MDPFKNKQWIGICRQREGEEDRSKHGRGPFWRQQKNVAKHEERLRGWRAKDKSQMKMIHKWPVFQMEGKDILQVLLWLMWSELHCRTKHTVLFNL